MPMFSLPNTLLLVIDVQGNLVPKMRHPQVLIERLKICVQAFQILGVPIILTEQVPQKIGSTIMDIARLCPQSPVFEKASFSCFGSPAFVDRLNQTGRRQVVVAGIETHVCVYQTVCDLLAARCEVQVVVDAVSSRSERDKHVALHRMKDEGAKWTTAEMIIIELLKTSEHGKFREVLGLIK